MGRSPAAAVRKSIPTDLPFVVRHRLGKRMVPTLPVVGALSIVGLCGGGTVLARAEDVAQALTGVLLAAACLAASVVTPYLLMRAVFGRRPVLAVGHEGLWISTRPARGRAIWLPWGAIARIDRRARLWDRMLVITPYGAQVTKRMGGYSGIDQIMLDAVWSGTFTASMTFCDRTEEQVLLALRHYSAGRCQIS